MMWNRSSSPGTGSGLPPLGIVAVYLAHRTQGCVGDMGCAPVVHRQARQILVARYEPGTDHHEQHVLNPPVCANCGCAGTPYCTMTGQLHVIVGSPRETHGDRLRREYLMMIYDSPTLLQELLRYVSQSIPRSLTINGKEVRDECRIQCRSDISNGDPTAVLHLGTGKVMLKDVRSLTIGRGRGSRGYYNPFETKKASQEGYIRTLGIVLSSKSTILLRTSDVEEMEARMIVISQICQLPPTWALPMDISFYRESMAHLDSFERVACSMHNIPPPLFLQLVALIEHKRDSVLKSNKYKQGKWGIQPGLIDPATKAILVTRGELRYWSMCDIFRTCALWCLLSRRSLIYDPNFAWVSPKMTLVSSFPVWSICSHDEAPAILREFVRDLHFVFKKK
eukprot:Sspe_Gene.64447::Locus_38119_Transcript_1_1_Confidence_1.000_Length_1289::g.64447::m.64447